ncbi:hypothetical protein GALMADRAFT_147546 [Galerina marginata CBS 339.88]|uniref:F-box domain-containing protein n=1 Tax=Galerina marginata (strain CBS 339.88) TaxID=685588 RepID=A0A067SAE3_GALM3|nr:hypothetical protein GALMADRAFT_147546 [Galerina marginata CBS 339.88]
MVSVIQHRLPLDVFSVVIDILSSDLDTPAVTRLQTLIALSLSCRLLLEPSRKGIFREITIRRRLQSRRSFGRNSRRVSRVPQLQQAIAPEPYIAISFEEMKTLLYDKPFIANYVRSLTCQFCSIDYDGTLYSRVLRKFGRLQSLTVMPHTHILPFDAILDPKRFEAYDSEGNWGSDSEHDEVDEAHEDDWGLDSDYDEAYDPDDGFWQPDGEHDGVQRFMSWYFMSQPLRNALRKLMGLPTLAFLKLSHITNFPTQVLAFSRGLQVLNLSRCQLASIPSGGIILPKDHYRVRLQELRISPGGKKNVERLKGFLSPRVPVLELSHMHELSFTIPTEFDVPQLGELLDGLLHLETLALTFNDFSKSIGQTIATHAHRLANLRNLRIRRGTVRKANFQNTLLSQVLDSLLSLNKLEEVDIRIDAYPTISTVFATDLEMVALNLSDASMFPELKSVAITVFWSEDEPEEFPVQVEEEDILEADPFGIWDGFGTTHLAVLVNRKSVHVSYSVKDIYGRAIAS